VVTFSFANLGGHFGVWMSCLTKGGERDDHGPRGQFADYMIAVSVYLIMMQGMLMVFASKPKHLDS
jgi:hypothetical protein